MELGLSPWLHIDSDNTNTDKLLTMTETIVGFYHRVDTAQKYYRTNTHEFYHYVHSPTLTEKKEIYECVNTAQKC